MSKEIVIFELRREQEFVTRLASDLNAWSTSASARVGHGHRLRPAIAEQEGGRKSRPGRNRVSALVVMGPPTAGAVGGLFFTVKNL